MTKVALFPGETNLKRSAGQVLDAASDAGLTSVVVVGMTSDGRLWAYSSDPNVAEVNLLLDRAKVGYLDRLDRAE